MSKAVVGDRIFVAKESFVVRFEGADRHFTAGQTRVREGHPILRGRSHLFEAIEPHYEVESASAAPGEKRGA